MRRTNSSTSEWLTHVLSLIGQAIWRTNGSRSEWLTNVLSLISQAIRGINSSRSEWLTRVLSLSVLIKFYNQNKALPLPIYGQCFLKYQPDTFIKPPLVILFPRGTLKFQLTDGGGVGGRSIPDFNAKGRTNFVDLSTSSLSRFVPFESLFNCKWYCYALRLMFILTSHTYYQTTLLSIIRGRPTI